MTGAGWKTRGLSWVVAGGFAGWAAARIFAVDKHQRAETVAVPVLSFTPQVAKAAPWAALALSVTGRRGAATTTAVAAAALGVLVNSRKAPRFFAFPTGPRLNVLSQNMYFGRTDIEILVARVRQFNVDVLFLQELTDDAVHRLKQAGLDEMLPHAQLDLRGGSRGSGIYSRFPLSDGPAVPPTHMAQPTALAELPDGYQVELICAHPVTPNLRRRGSEANWRDELEAIPAPGDLPRVIAGDFNATVDHAAFRDILRRGYSDAALQTGNGLQPTWGPPGRRAVLTLDHVLVDKQSAVLSYSAHLAPGSDHYAVYAEIQLPEHKQAETE
jgi:endonuclease/exonuclease/phosphatase family metal-dependent hydrolase